MPFSYGGCLGNGNRFNTKVQCQETCLRAATEDLDVCSQPLEPGPCRGTYTRFYYDQVDGECKAFNYTGCRGNRNRFSDLESCENSCKHKAALAKAKRVCHLPMMSGPCDEKIASWHFDSRAKICRPFYFSGCGGNENRFESRAACEKSCPNAFPPEMSVAASILVLEEGQDAVFKVTVEANPPPKVQWLYKDVALDIEADERLSKSETDHSLTISKALIADSGLYTVTADNGLGHVARRQVTLQVHPSRMPIEVEIDKRVTEFEIGREIKFSCSVRGYPIPVIRWYKNNTPLRASARISFLELDNALVVTKATQIDGGVYTCRATNKHESVFDNIEVSVKEGEKPKEECKDDPNFANCALIVRARACNRNKYYPKFCCK